MEKLFSTSIPVPPEMENEFLAWCEHLDITAKKTRKTAPYYLVNYSDGVQLYWLAANLFGTVPTSALSQHGPDTVQAARIKDAKTTDPEELSGTVKAWRARHERFNDIANGRD